MEKVFLRRRPKMSRRIITISREYASGGSQIGKMLSERLGIPCYDREIIGKVAAESGLCEKFIEDKGEYGNKVAIETYFATGMYYNGPSVEDSIWAIQHQIIEELAEKEPCIIVGRCADYILSTSDQIDNKDLLNVFIYADIDAKLKRIEEIYKETESCAKKTIIQIDKRRANHYNTFTENIWGDRKNYDMMINSTTAGIEATAKWIVELAKA